MRRTMTMLIVLAITSLACAGEIWDHPANPDRRASFNLGFKVGSLNGDGSMYHVLWPWGLPFRYTDHITAEKDLSIISGSFRAPMSDNVTAEMTIDHIDETDGYSGRITGFHYRMSGELFGFNIRYYLQN